MKRILNYLLLHFLIHKGNKSLNHLQALSLQAKQASEDLLLQIMRDNVNTEYGQKYAFSKVDSIADFQNQVPFSTYDDYAYLIDKSVENKVQNLVSAYPTRYYAMTSGSTDNPKKIPVSQKTLDVYSDYSFCIMLAVADRYMRKTKGRGLHKGLVVGAMQIVESYAKDGTPKGAISMAAMNKVKKALPFFVTTPVPAIQCTDSMDKNYIMLRFALERSDIPCLMTPFMTTLADMMHYMELHHELIVRDIERGCIDDSINMPSSLREELQAYLKPRPKRAEQLRGVFAQGFDTPILPRVWPNLDFIGGIGTGSFSIYAEKMRRYSGDIPFLYSVYAASESLMGVAVEMEQGEYVLLPQSGFYEFIPVADPGKQGDEDESDTANPKTKLLHELEEGRCYEIVITNLSGFYRYRIGDVVRCMGYQNETPKICFVYRKNQMVNIAGEKTDEECIARAVKGFEEKTGESIMDFSIFADTQISPGRYVLFMEPAQHLPQENHEQYREIVDELLAKVNPSIGKKVKDGTLSPSDVRFLQQQTYALYRDLQAARGISENQLKPVRVIDTLVKEKFFFALIDE